MATSHLQGHLPTQENMHGTNPLFRNVRDFYYRGTTVHAWLNNIVYIPRTPEMLTQNLIQMFVASGAMSLLYHDPIQLSLAQMR